VLDRTSRHAIVASVAFSGAGTTVSSQNRLDLARDLLRLEIGAPERGVDRHCPERRLQIYVLQTCNTPMGKYALKFLSFWIAILRAEMA
jgi:hypothetical protein